MTVSDIEKLIPILNAHGVYFFKSGDIELIFKQAVPSTITVATADGKTVTAISPEKPIETIKSTDAPLPTDNLETEAGMNYDKLLNWSAGGDYSVEGTNDGLTNDQPIDDPKINGASIQ